MYIVAWSCLTCQPKDVFSLAHRVLFKVPNNYQHLKLGNSSTFPIVYVTYLLVVGIQVSAFGLYFFLSNFPDFFFRVISPGTLFFGGGVITATKLMSSNVREQC